MVRSARAVLRRGGLPAMLVACTTLASCGPRQPKLSVEQYTAIQRQLEAQADSGGPQPGATPAPGAASAATPGPSPLPPRDDAERRARAGRALPGGVAIAALEAVGNGSRYAMALATARRDGAIVAPNLLLFDVASPQGVLLGEHDFGLEQPGAEAPTRLGHTLLLDASPEEPVVLAELFLPEGAREPFFGACGWWMRRRKAAFLCAPRLTPASRYQAQQGQLVELWPVDGVGARSSVKAGNQSGRKLRFVDGRWQETDSFRCMGRPLPEALKEAGSRTLTVWQQDTVQQLTRAASRASEALETDVAIARLRDALAVDGCAPGTWRLLGRLEFEAGRPEAADTLAIALALAPRDEGVVVDLADALVVLDVAKPGRRETWHSVLAVLGSRPTTRAFVEGGAGQSPQALASALYRAFLERTPPDDEWLAARRRKVEEKLARLGAGRARRK